MVSKRNSSKEKIESDVKLFGLEEKFDVSVLSSPPELFNFIDLELQKNTGDKKRLVVYPDPPLGVEELDVLNEFDKKLQFLTPIMLSKII